MELLCELVRWPLFGAGEHSYAIVDFPDCYDCSETSLLISENGSDDDNCHPNLFVDFVPHSGSPYKPFGGQSHFILGSE